MAWPTLLLYISCTSTWLYSMDPNEICVGVVFSFIIAVYRILDFDFNQMRLKSKDNRNYKKKKFGKNWHFHIWRPNLKRAETYWGQTWKGPKPLATLLLLPGHLCFINSWWTNSDYYSIQKLMVDKYIANSIYLRREAVVKLVLPFFGWDVVRPACVVIDSQLFSMTFSFYFWALF